ncbi:MAG: sigma-54 dependent transcriptional regulator [Steroidobacter sp.]
MSPRILVVDDEAEICRLLNEILRDEGYSVDIAQNAQEARQSYINADYSLVLLDIWMPDTDGITLLREWSASQLKCPVVMMSGHGTIEAAIEATRLGAADFIEKPLSLSKLLQVVKQALANSKQLHKTPALLGHQPTMPSGKSRAMQQLREALQHAASNHASILLLGEAGSGRETGARFLHANSLRSQSPLVMLTPAILNDDTAPIELFGDVATKTVGLLSRARGGTLLIKGLEDASPLLQKLLLGALESKSFTPVGSTQSETLDVRLISTAQTGFNHRIGQQGFRADLFIHLNTFIIQIPALRERAEDVPELLRYYAERIADEERLQLRRFDVSAQNRLRNYPWPGNVQELRNLVRRLLMVGGSEDIHLEEIDQVLHAQASEQEPLVKHDLLALPLREAREHFERAYLQQQLILCDGKVGQLAKRVGMERTHLYRKLRTLGVDIKQLADE